MKKCLSLVAFALLVGTAFVSAEVDTWSKPGSVEARAGLGLYWHGFGQVQGGVDVGLSQVPIAPTFPLDLGVAGRLAYAGELGAAVYAKADYSWKALRTGQSWLDGLETYLGLGVAVLPYIGFDAMGGVEYHFNKSWSIYAEAGQFGGVLGGAYRF
jgi:hypothetical protein